MPRLAARVKTSDFMRRRHPSRTARLLIVGACHPSWCNVQVIVNDEQMRAMDFIAFVNRGGYRPTGRVINEWRLMPDLKPGGRGRLLEAEVPAVPERRVRVGGVSPFDNVLGGASYKGFNSIGDSLAKQLSGISRAQLAALNSGVVRAIQSAGLASALTMPGVEYKTIPGKPGKPAVYGPDQPPEKFLAHLRRLGWIERDTRGGYGLTLLGHALLRSEAASEMGDDDSSVMVLAADDELAYGRVMGVIAECGDAFIMDAYLGTEELINVLKHTSASRFLVGDKLPRNRLTELAILIELTPPGPSGATRELRQAAFHDRWVVGDHKLYGLGASINGVGGKSMTTLVEMPDSAARFIRAAAYELWAKATSVAETRHAAADDLGNDDSDDHKLFRREDDRFMHDGCTVRHKTRRAAENCSNGKSR